MMEPEYRIMLTYDIQPNQFEAYFQYVTREFVPTLHQLGLPMIFAWQIYGGQYPERRLDFVCESRVTLEQAITSERFIHAEEKLKVYTDKYNRKVVRFENRHQF